MIELVGSPAREREFLRRTAGKLFFTATMGAHLTVYSQKPASGWRFYLLPGQGALALRGRSASVCGPVDDPEELAALLNFLGVTCATCEQGAPAGFALRRTLHGFVLPGGAPLKKAAPPGLVLDEAPSLGPVMELLFAGEEAETKENFYSDACTLTAHGLARIWTARDAAGQIVSTVGCYARYGGESYLACGETREPLRGQGIGGWLISSLAQREAETGSTVTFLCEPERCHFYETLGFIQTVLYKQYYTERNNDV